MNQNESLLDVAVLLYKWKKQILGATFIAAVLTAIVSLTLPNYYEAHTLFYAASPDLADPMPLGHNAERKYVYGSDSDLDRLFSIAKSNEVTSFLLQKFDLYTHYDINPEDPKARYKLALKLNKLFKTTKTKFDAIDLSVEDKDPLLAAEIANAARQKIDALAQTVTKASQRKKIDAYKAGIANKEKHRAYLTDSLMRTKAQYNIFSAHSQGESYSEKLLSVEGNFLKADAEVKYLKASKAPRDSIMILSAKRNGYKSQLDKLKSDIISFNTGFPAVQSLERNIRDFGNQLNLDKERTRQLETAYNAEISAIHLIEAADKPVIKSRPKRSILVIGVTFLTFALMCLWVIIKDQFNKNNWRAAFKNA